MTVSVDTHLIVYKALPYHRTTHDLRTEDLNSQLGYDRHKAGLTNSYQIAGEATYSASFYSKQMTENRITKLSVPICRLNN